MPWLLALLLVAPLHADPAPPPHLTEAAKPPPCVRSGPMVEVLWGIPSDRTKTGTKKEIRSYVAEADVAIGGVRWKCGWRPGLVGDSIRTAPWIRRTNFDGVAVRQVELPPVGYDGFNFGDARGWLNGQSPRSDRIYVLFYDDGSPFHEGWTDSYGPCGQGEVHFGTGNALAFVDCWGTWTLVHELGHTLGAVPLSAPNSDGGWHCSDSLDFMCYGGVQRQVCPVVTFDCGNDDYFDHGGWWWDVADSPFLRASPTDS